MNYIMAIPESVLDEFIIDENEDTRKALKTLKEKGFGINTLEITVKSINMLYAFICLTDKEDQLKLSEIMGKIAKKLTEAENESESESENN